MENIWDKKSKSYPKFTNSLSEFQIEFFDFLGSSGVDFSSKSVVDIGCGTGVYTLYIAKFAKSILGVDTSPKMLEILNQTASEFGIKNVQTKVGSLQEISENFDISFLTMSPALKDENDFAKFLSLGKTRVYMNWQAQRSSDLLEPFFAKFGRKNSQNTALKFENYLIKNKINYKSTVLEEFRTAKRDLAATFENVLWHLEINECKFDKNEVFEELKKLVKDGFIEENLSSSMKVLVL
ncbi:SAM-dependent methyltransferase [Campylobacter iguaniorum]|uniref:class I SAM-dependent methyltransferase n=1 Tax=Campylobacter iguaniorum TaxID=1244531 RepID=UPI00073A87A0|nr:class I SAM-dependent methyltransferase [Campylobacter iguaniorum]ALV25363.1 SAM-dependent methyltransferase [Campylobacter iguaniorum]